MKTDSVYNFSGFFPEVHLPGGVVFPTYFPIISLSFCACLYWLVRRIDRRGLKRNDGLDIALALMTGGFIGARLFHVFFEEPSYYLEKPLRVLEIWRGGFVWYGGAILGSIAAVIVIQRRHLQLRKWLDIFAPVCALGYAVGRSACLVTGCCFGRVCVLNDFRFRYPTQAFAVIWEAGTLLLLIYLERVRSGSTSRRLKNLVRADGQIFFVWLILHALGRIVMEIFRGDPRGPDLLSLSVSTWISGVLFIYAVFLFTSYTRQRR